MDGEFPGEGTEARSVVEIPLSTGLGTLLRHLVERLDGDVEALYATQGLNCRSRFTPVIRHLEREGPSSIRDISRSSGLSHSAISQTVSGMLKNGLVRSSQGTDGRERIVSFTRKGRAMLPRLNRVWEAVWATSDDLSVEIGVSLPLAAGKALAALDERSFRDRISQRLNAAEDTQNPRLQMPHG